MNETTKETQLDRIEALLRQLLEALIRMNIRLDVVCGHEQGNKHNR
jgi:hypothetical protein